MAISLTQNAEASNQMEIGIYTFGETTRDPRTGRMVSTAQRMRDLIEEVQLADQVGLDVYGVGGLYFVGAGTHPGAGVPGVLCSAKVLERVVPRLSGNP